jgi:BASS family bile acid:Na+ symporter
MSLEQFVNLLVTVTLIEMMATIGLGIRLEELRSVLGNVRLMVNALVANYVLVPAATIGLLLAFRSPPAVAAGFLILAVCPGAPFGPPMTLMARGNVTVAVGLMAVLAGTSAVLAPMLLSLLLPWIAGSDAGQINPVRLVTTLLATQLVPLCVGMVVRHRSPAAAERLIPWGRRLSQVLNLGVIALILGTQARLLSEIRLRGCLGMLALLIASFVSGWLLGGPGGDGRRAMTVTTALRNLGLGLVIATATFGGTPAVTAVLAYGLLELLGTLLLALFLGKQQRRPLTAAGE